VDEEAVVLTTVVAVVAVVAVAPGVTIGEVLVVGTSGQVPHKLRQMRRMVSPSITNPNCVVPNTWSSGASHAAAVIPSVLQAGPSTHSTGCSVGAVGAVGAVDAVGATVVNISEVLVVGEPGHVPHKLRQMRRTVSPSTTNPNCVVPNTWSSGASHAAAVMPSALQARLSVQIGCCFVGEGVMEVLSSTGPPPPLCMPLPLPPPLPTVTCRRRRRASRTKCVS
jgi:LysM repeat protein